MVLCVLSPTSTYSALHCARLTLVALCLSLVSRQFCAWRECATCPLCGLKEASVNTERVVETSRRRVLVEVQLENKGENAYNTQLHISHSPNLHFSSLMVKVCLHTHTQTHYTYKALWSWAVILARIGSKMQNWHFDTWNSFILIFSYKFMILNIFIGDTLCASGSQSISMTHTTRRNVGYSFIGD